jgi:L-lactate dehydrogenase complex protein LldE
MEVDIFIPCFVDQLHPQTGFNMVKLLEHKGVKVNYNPNQTCCGQMAFNSGFWDEAKTLGIKFIKDFNSGKPVVGLSTSCIGYVKNYFEKLFYNTPWHLENRKLKGNLYEITDFLVNVLKAEDFGATFNATVTYHDSCAALREYKLGDEPRKLLSKVRGLRLVEMKNREECCGFGGTFSIKHEPISAAMAEQKVEDALETGAEYIISTDLSCLIQLEAYIKKHQIALKTLHIVDLLAQGIEHVADHEVVPD